MMLSCISKTHAENIAQLHTPWTNSVDTDLVCAHILLLVGCAESLRHGPSEGCRVWVS